MTSGRGLDHRLSAWLEAEGSRRAPERLVHATREEIARTAQVGSLGRWRQAGARWVVAGRVAALAGGAVVAVLALTLTIRGFGASVGGRSANPGGVPSASAVARCGNSGTACASRAPSVTYRSNSFLPTVTFAMLPGWELLADRRGELDLKYLPGGSYTYHDGTEFSDGIAIFRQPVAESATSVTAVPGIGRSAKDLADWLARDHRLLASGFTPVTIAGISGYRIEIALPAGSNAKPDHCSTDHGEPRCASLFFSGDPATNYSFGIVGPEVALIYLLDASSGDTVVVVIDDPDGVNVAGLLSASNPIVDSLAFAP